MSVNFYNDLGMMLAIDFHKYPLGGIDTPLPHLVGAPMSRVLASSWKRTATVSADGVPMIQKGHDLLLFEHLPLVVPAGIPAGVAIDAVMIRLGASSKADLAKNSVTGQGTALAMCVDGPLGLSSNCTTPAIPIGTVLQLGSVKTMPSLGDIIAWLVAIAIKYFVNQASEGAWGGNPRDSKDKSDSPDIALRKLAAKWLTEAAKEILKLLKKAAPPEIQPWVPVAPMDLPSQIGKALGDLVDQLTDSVDGSEQ